jgi:hypothetical protein
MCSRAQFHLGRSRGDKIEKIAPRRPGLKWRRGSNLGGSLRHRESGNTLNRVCGNPERAFSHSEDRLRGMSRSCRARGSQNAIVAPMYRAANWSLSARNRSGECRGGQTRHRGADTLGIPFFHPLGFLARTSAGKRLAGVHGALLFPSFSCLRSGGRSFFPTDYFQLRRAQASSRMAR